MCLGKTIGSNKARTGDLFVSMVLVCSVRTEIQNKAQKSEPTVFVKNIHVFILFLPCSIKHGLGVLKETVTNGAYIIYALKLYIYERESNIILDIRGGEANNRVQTHVPSRHFHYESEILVGTF